MSRSRNVLTGWKYAGFIGAIVGAIGLATYPIIISPYLYPEKWQKMSKEIRKEAGIKQEEIQPGNMKVKIKSIRGRRVFLITYFCSGLVRSL